MSVQCAQIVQFHESGIESARQRHQLEARNLGHSSGCRGGVHSDQKGLQVPQSFDDDDRVLPATDRDPYARWRIACIAIAAGSASILQQWLCSNSLFRSSTESGTWRPFLNANSLRPLS